MDTNDHTPSIPRLKPPGEISLASQLGLAPPIVAAADPAADAEIDKTGWPTEGSKIYLALMHIAHNPGAQREGIALASGCDANSVSGLLNYYLKKGVVHAIKVPRDGCVPVNAYYLLKDLPVASTETASQPQATGGAPTPAGEQGKPAIEPTESANSEGIDTATQPSSPAATPPGSSDEGQCLHKAEAPLTHSVITAARPHPEVTHLHVRRCRFAVDDEGFVGIGDGYGNVKLSYADVEAFLTWAERARPLWQAPPPQA